ncbi:type VI secretion system baseplate subunit TssF [Desulfococcaceae bacterium HSG7]|nr:type VI secretion system baseplate subunit TssF [Desulfococcaceae bacterium HSG7]
MFNRYYNQELNNLRELAVEFSKTHPVLAPYLNLDGRVSDPDVERILEGVAFLNGLLRQKLDDEFPEIIHGLTDVVFPHYLRPIPSASIIAFSPKDSLQESVTVPKGTSLASVPVDGTSCLFQTCFAVEVHPLQLTDARFIEPPGKASKIRISIKSPTGNLNTLSVKRLRFFLGGNYADAADLYLLLNQHINSVTILPKQGGQPLTLPSDVIKPAGFAEHESLIPYPSQTFTGYRLLQEYFLLPEKFLFIDITGFDKWTDRGDGHEFDIDLELKSQSAYPPPVKRESFVLSACPVINLFKHHADPIMLDHRRSTYHVRPSGDKADHFQVYSVESVIGVIQGSLTQKKYSSLEEFDSGGTHRYIYQLEHKASVSGKSVQIYLSLPYSVKSASPERESISIELLCTNGSIAEGLQVGDISQHTIESPHLMEFKNLTPPTNALHPLLGDNMLWQFLSHLSLNYLSLANTDNLKDLLALYSFPYGREQAQIIANEKRIDGIVDIQVKPSDRLVDVYLMRGQDIRVDLQADNFAGQGDLFLFGSVLDRFFGVYTHLNSYTQFTARDIKTGSEYLWQPKIGKTPLL